MTHNRHITLLPGRFLHAALLTIALGSGLVACDDGPPDNPPSGSAGASGAGAAGASGAAGRDSSGFDPNCQMGCPVPVAPLYCDGTIDYPCPPDSLCCVSKHVCIEPGDPCEDLPRAHRRGGLTAPPRPTATGRQRHPPPPGLAAARGRSGRPHGPLPPEHSPALLPRADADGPGADRLTQHVANSSARGALPS